MEKKKLTNQDLLDIPEFLKRQSDSDKAESKSVEAKIEVKEEPKQEEVQVVKEAEPVKEKPKKPSIQDRMRTRFFVIMGDIHDEFEKYGQIMVIQKSLKHMIILL